MAIPFDEKELETSEVISAIPGKFPEVAKFNTPVTSQEGSRRAFAKKPEWIMTWHDYEMFNPRVFVDNVCRGLVDEDKKMDPSEYGGNDMFGIPWVYEKEAGGSMVPTGFALFDDANDWKDYVKFPNFDEWDWETSAAENNDTWLGRGRFSLANITTGWFERLISFMGFEDAAVAMVDEDQEDAVIELFDALSDCYCDLIDHFHKYYPNLDGFYIHDDWGTALQPFFSFNAAEDLIVPAMKKVTDHIHELGMFAELHSCGNHGAVQLPNIIAAGWDAWAPQPLNDIDALFQQYGDKIMLSPMLPDITGMSDDEARAAAREYVQKYCTTPGKAIKLQISDEFKLANKAFWEELYKESRKAYAAWPEA